MRWLFWALAVRGGRGGCHHASHARGRGWGGGCGRLVDLHLVRSVLLLLLLLSFPLNDVVLGAPFFSLFFPRLTAPLDALSGAVRFDTLGGRGVDVML